MPLYADRFWLDPRDSDRVERATTTQRRVRDLAAPDPVVLIESSAGGPAEQLQWSMRCGRFASLHHASLARLVDFGLVGGTRRFEAWRAGSPWQGDQAAARAHAMVQAFLRASDLSPCDAGAQVVDCGGGPGVIPDAQAGRETEPTGTVPIDGLTLSACGVESMARPALTAIGELLNDADRREPTVVALWGEPGCGLRVAATALARVARLNGIVPISAACDDPAVWQAVTERTLLLIDRVDRADGAAIGCGWRRLLEATGRRGRAHVLLMLARAPVPRVHSLRLDAIDAGTLAEAVRPHAWLAANRAVIDRTAARAAGSPARFAAALWRPSAASRHIRLMAAEHAPRYDSTGAARAGRTAPRAWPVSGDVAALRQRLGAATRRLEGGRHVTAAREIRSLMSALARRQDWRAAAEGGASLATSLVRRGQSAEAGRVLADARDWAQRVPDGSILADLTLIGVAVHLDQGALGDAEAAARSVLAAAHARNHHPQVVASSAALSRVLFWQGRFADATDAIARVDDGTGDDRATVALASASARAAVGLSNGAGAYAAAARAVAAGERLADAHWLARAVTIAAFIHLAAGDLALARQMAARAVLHAHRARDPLLALHVRLIDAEAHRREGRVAPAERLLTRVARMPRRSLPAPFLARVSLMRELLAGADEGVVARVAASTGFRALTLFAPRATATVGAEPQVDDMLDLVRRMQEAEDDTGALVSMSAGLRERLRAVAVGFVALEGTGYRVVALEGARLDTGTADRACAAGRYTVAVSATGGAEAGVPVCYGGRTLGALVARWSPGATPHSERVAGLLALGSALAAPAVAAAIRGPALPLTDEIVGVSDGMQAVRRAIERAAPVPYPVLVEGESGSGKELVARALHRRGARRDRAFVAVNCAAIPDDLVEAELFGHAKGAFTGAMVERPGVFEEAHGGTLFLDEVGELSLRAQAKLLRTLQESEIRRVGENVPRRVDVRVVTATNRNLRREVTSGAFRLDLLYRLDVVRITVPPLRERLPDLPLLIDRYWREATERVQSRAVLSAATVAALAHYAWPGNVRELQNVLAALAVRAPRRGVVPPSALPWSTAAADVSALRLDAARRAFEQQFVRAALVRTGGHRGRAASDLGLTRQGLTKLMSRLAITNDAPAHAGHRAPHAL